MPPEALINSDSDLESVISYQDCTPALKTRRESGPKYKCSTEGCNAVFKRLDQLDRHEYHHTGIKRHACTYDGCDKIYSILTHLKRHLRSTHERVATPTKNVPCTRCDKLFHSSCNMQRHIREVHENPKVYRCPHCDEKFTQKLKMRRHEINAHTGAFPHRCDKCGKGFYQQWQYDRHIENADCKVYNCAQCNVQFDKWSLYRKHCRETQHGRKYYKCERCEMAYPKPGELQQHMLLKHLDVAGERQLEHKCKQDGCEKSYAYLRNLQQHMRTAHKGQRFPCKVTDCGLDFSSAQNLSKHMLRGHSGGDVGERSKKVKKAAAKKRKQRRDAGRPVISHLAALSGIAVDRPLNTLLRARDEEALQVVSEMLSQEINEQQASTESEAEEPPQKITRPQSADEFDNLLAMALANGDDSSTHTN